MHLSTIIKILQYTFQVVLSTDGNLSFAFFIYEDPESLNGITSHDWQIGFNAGNGVEGINIMGSDSSVTYTRNLTQVNIYRLDGKPCNI